MNDSEEKQISDDSALPAPAASPDSGIVPIGENISRDDDDERGTNMPQYRDEKFIRDGKRGGVPENDEPVREYEANGTSGDESMRGGFASVKGKRVFDRTMWTVIIVMAIMCIAVAICSSVITAFLMRRGEKPPVINSGGDVQQNVAAVVSARQSSIAEVNCGGLRGSGIVMKRDGNNVYIVTNAHVLRGYISNGSSPSVRFYGEDGFYEATVVGYDENYDVAVMRIAHNTKFTVFDLDGSEYFSPNTKYAAGDYVVSIGNAMGLGVAAYDGIISRHDELLECDKLFGGGKKYVPVLRTTAVINAGMSGGGVFDMSGNLIALGTYRLANSAGVDQEGAANTDVEDTGFATPVSVLYPVYRRIMAEASGGAVGLISVDAKTVGTSAIGWIGTPFGFNCEYRNGALTVTALDKNVGGGNVRVGDVITAIGDLDVTNDICAVIGKLLCYHPRGDGVALTLTLERNGSERSVTFDNYRYAI